MTHFSLYPRSIEVQYPALFTLLLTCLLPNSSVFLTSHSCQFSCLSLTSSATLSPPVLVSWQPSCLLGNTPSLYSFPYNTLLLHLSHNFTSLSYTYSLFAATASHLGSHLLWKKKTLLSCCASQPKQSRTNIISVKTGL